MSFDISLYGHLTVDRIFEGFTRTNGLGSIANVWKALIIEDPTLNIYISPTEIGEAIVYVDKNTSERFSKASLSNHISKPTILESKINHILYSYALANFLYYLQNFRFGDV